MDHAVAVIKYIGSKRRLLPAILDVVAAGAGAASARGGARTAVDLFSGTARVGHALKGKGFAVQANDHNLNAWHLARCFVEADADLAPAVAAHIAALNALPPQAGWFTTTFCEQARFFHPTNGARIDAVRQAIADMKLDPLMESVLLVSLMEAADRVDSTVGLQMAYLKSWAPRALQPLLLRVPALLPRAAGGAGKAWRKDAREAARALTADVCYLDPPYNQHSYLGNYHVWESLVAWDKPEVYGLAMKRVDVKTRKSEFNSKTRFLDALEDVVLHVDAGLLVVSFNNEGYIDRDAMVQLLSRRGAVTVQSVAHPRYVGARIGIYNPRGEKVGKVSHLQNRELIFVVDTKRKPARSPRRARKAS